MKRITCIFFLLFAGIGSIASGAVAQSGSVEFVARATPSGGLEEPVRGFPFFLLSKSFEAIEKDADAASPKPDMDAFIAKLDVSPLLKAWMRKNNWVSLSGDDFIHKVKPDDVMDIPEFNTAYMDRNAGNQSVDFPQPKFKPSDKTKNPAKYEKLNAEYLEEVRHYVEEHPKSIDGIDAGLAEIDPTSAWRSIIGKRPPEIRRRALDLAQSTYLVARTETNLQGQGFLRNIPPGTYWLSTLDVPAAIGDERALWDFQITIQPGETKEVLLSNSNAIQSSALLQYRPVDLQRASGRD